MTKALFASFRFMRPSRSADIEQTLILGAHGPRRLHVIVVGDAAAA